MRHFVCIVLLVLVLGCGKKKGSATLIGGVGTRIAAGLTTDLRISPDGNWAAYLKEASKPRLEGVPATMRVGELHVVPTAGGEAHKLGNGVSNFPGGYLFTPDSKWVLQLVGYNASAQAGELDIAPVDGSSGAEKLGSRVTYMLASPDSKWVAFVDEGILKLGPLPKGPFRDVNGEVANAVFSADARVLFFKRKQSAGGSLLAVKVADVKDVPKKLADLVGEYRLGEGGRLAFTSKVNPSAPSFRLYLADVATLKDQLISDKVYDFRFSQNGKWLARLEGAPGDPGGELNVSPSDGSAPARKLATVVGDYAFAPDMKKIAWRQNYSPDRTGEGVGDLYMAELPDGAPRLVGHKARSFEWSPDSQAIAFAFNVVKPLPSVNLYLWKIGADAAVHLKDWAYDYDFTAQSDRLLFRADCVREGRACNLISVSVANPAEPPKKLIEGVFGFRISADGQRVLYTYARMQGDLYDTGVLNLKTSEYKTLDQQIRMAPYMLNEGGTKVAYIIAEPKREGVYVADKVP